MEADVMLFTPENARKVMHSKKTMTRRIISRYEMFYADKDTPPTVYVKCPDGKQRIKWQVGRTYAVQPGRGKASIGRVKLLGLFRERLQDISDADVCAELGVAADIRMGRGWLRNAFAELWDSINKMPGTRYLDNPKVNALTFELVEG
jgi:hypothetical protein